MYCSLCFDWLAERSQKVAIIAIIQDAMASGVVASASFIASDVKKLWAWIWVPLVCDKILAICVIVVPPSGGWRDSGTSLNNSASTVVMLRPWRGGSVSTWQVLGHLIHCISAIMSLGGWWCGACVPDERM